MPTYFVQQQEERNSNSYSEAGSVYEELRAVAGELQIPVWSASTVELWCS